MKGSTLHAPRDAAVAPALSAESPPRLLLVEDEEHFREGLVQTLEAGGFAVTACASAEAALHAFAKAAPEVVLTDLRLPGIDGLGMLARCLERESQLPVVLMTGHADIATAVKAIRDGAYDFIEKPFGRDRLLTLLNRAARAYRLAAENRSLRGRLAAGSGLAGVMLGDSRALRELRELIVRIAPAPVDVLVTGETGTGKELVARALHDFGDRRGNFVPINCAALPEALIESELYGHEAGAYTGAAKARVGRIEHAQGGTLFLDEVQAMPQALQAKLLRVLQERKLTRLGSNKEVAVEVRVVAASNEELEPLVEQGRFRADLYYRLNVVALRLPPLRERRDDVWPLFGHFLEQAALRFQRDAVAPSAELRERLLAHPWPGNVRELKSAAERLVLGLPALAGDAVAAGGAASRSLQATLDAIEALLIDDALRRCKGQVAAACAELDLPQATLYRKLKAHGLEAERYRTK